MYASIDFATKKDFCLAVREGQPFLLYSPMLGIPAVNGTVTVVGPWPSPIVRPLTEPMIGPKEKRHGRSVPAWTARVEVRDMRVVAVH